MYFSTDLLRSYSMPDPILPTFKLYQQCQTSSCKAVVHVLIIFKQLFFTFYRRGQMPHSRERNTVTYPDFLRSALIYEALVCKNYE